MSFVNEPGKPPHLKLPKFEPLPPDTVMNRIINTLLKPFFYLFFTLITAIIIIPVFTIIENMTSRSHAKNGQRNTKSSNYTMNGQAVENKDGSLQHFLRNYGRSYSGQGAQPRKGSAYRSS